MVKKDIAADIRELALGAADFLEEKKATAVTVLDIGHLTPLADYFILASGSIQLQLDSLSRNLQDHLAARGARPRYPVPEGQAGWVLLDYGDFVVHLFLEDQREFYKLERVWGDAQVLRPAAG